MADPKTYTEEEYNALVAEREALTAKRDELLGEVKTARGKLKTFEGIDPEKARTAEQRLLDLEQQKKAEKAGIQSEELTRLRAEVRQDLEKEYSDFKSSAERLSRENRELKLDTVVKGLMGKHGVRAERIDALYRLAGDRFDLTEDGKPMLKDRPGTVVEKFVAEDLSKEYPEFYQGTGSSGGGASKSAAGGGGSGRLFDMTTASGADFLANVERIHKREVTVKSQ